MNVLVLIRYCFYSNGNMHRDAPHNLILLIHFKNFLLLGVVSLTAAFTLSGVYAA